ncbi:hypothetical protein LSTR_LSTR001596 [Laodelphax striatellus]|uniref:Uncharacterized protein n=1 Tax=Laodelphax striatellus TaxID=195883 RepID=A0A482XBI6_LAOST|nr:hypothetical protein LSTR_LSTR001596 [Laodelphax striatellus]
MDDYQGKRTISETTSNTSSSISYKFVDKTESIHMKALGQLTEKIDQILSKIQSLKNVRATMEGSDSNLNKVSDCSIISKVGEVYSKGSIFYNLDSIDNQIGNAHLEMEDILDELKKSKEVLKLEHFVAKKHVLQRESSNCKRKLIRRMVKSDKKIQVDIHRHTRRFKYRKTNKTTRKLKIRIFTVLSKMPQMKNMISENISLKFNEFEYNFKHVSIGDSQMKTEKSTNKTVSNDNEIIVLYKRPIDNMFNDFLPSKDNEYNGATNEPDHNKEFSSDQHEKKDVCLKREIRQRVRTFSDPMIGNYKKIVPTILHAKNSTKSKYITSHRLSREENQPKYRTSNSNIDVNGFHGTKTKICENNKKRMIFCTSGTQTINMEMKRDIGNLNLNEERSSKLDKQLQTNEILYGQGREKFENNKNQINLCESATQTMQLETKGKVDDSNFDQERSSTFHKHLQTTKGGIKNSKRDPPNAEITTPKLIGEPGDRNILQKSKTVASTIEFSPLTIDIENKYRGTKFYSGQSTDIGYNAINVFPIKNGDKKRLKLNHGEKLLKYTLSFIDLKNKTKLLRRVVHSIKHSAERICEKYNESVAKYLARILENASLLYISPSLIFKYYNIIIQTEQIRKKQDLEYSKVLLFEGINSSYKHLIRKKQFQNKTKEHYHQRNKLNTIIDIEKRDSLPQQIHRLKLNNGMENVSRENQFTNNKAFYEEHSTQPGINFPNRFNATQNTEALENNENIVKVDNIQNQISDLVTELNKVERWMEINFERNFYNYRRNSRRMSQLILKTNSNLKRIMNLFKMMNIRMKALSVKQAEIQEFIIRYIKRSKVKNRIDESNSKNLSMKFRRLNNMISLEREFPKEKFENIINEQNDKFSHFHSEVNKLNKIVGKVEEHLAVYMHAIKTLKECVKFHSTKIENIDYVANLNAHQQNSIVNTLNDIEDYINNIDNAIQTSITSLEEDIYTNRYLIETGAKIIMHKINMQNEINEKLDEQIRKQDEDIGIIFTCILDLRKQMDGTTVERQRAQPITRELQEKNPQLHDLLRFVKEKISIQIQINKEFDAILQQHDRRSSHFEKFVNLNLKAQNEINNFVIENYEFLENEIHCLKVYTLSQSMTLNNKIRFCCKEIKYLQKIMNELLESKTLVDMNSSSIFEFRKYIVIGKKKSFLTRFYKSTNNRNLNKFVIVLLSICLISYVVILSLSFDLKCLTL